MVDLKIELPEGYLNEEIRDGFTVTTERKKRCGQSNWTCSRRSSVSATNTV